MVWKDRWGKVELCTRSGQVTRGAEERREAKKSRVCLGTKQAVLAVEHRVQRPTKENFPLISHQSLIKKEPNVSVLQSGLGQMSNRKRVKLKRYQIQILIHYTIIRGLQKVNITQVKRTLPFNYKMVIHLGPKIGKWRPWRRLTDKGGWERRPQVYCNLFIIKQLITRPKPRTWRTYRRMWTTIWRASV